MSGSTTSACTCPSAASARSSVRHRRALHRSEPQRDLHRCAREAGIDVRLIGGADVAAELDAKRHQAGHRSGGGAVMDLTMRQVLDTLARRRPGTPCLEDLLHPDAVFRSPVAHKYRMPARTSCA